MKLSRRTLIRAAPLVAAPLVVGAGFSRSRAFAHDDQPRILFERGSSISSRFARALPSNLERFEIRDSGALQYHEIADLMADTSKLLLGLTAAATFLMLERLAIEFGRAFVMTGIHLPCCERGNIHVARAGLASSETSELPDNCRWVEVVAKSYLAMALAEQSSVHSIPEEVEEDAVGPLSQPVHSWLLG